MARRLVVLFDGTWNKLRTHTNVSRLWEMIAPRDPDGFEQLCLYEKGVGVAPGIKHLLGGAFGMGLSEQIKHAYGWLAETWRDGDEIWLFGFSRGAYSARSLGGLIRKCGLLRAGASGRATAAAVDDAYAYYRNDVKPGVLINGSDPTAVWRAERHARELPIQFIGVWDTVGTLGIPGVASWFPFARKRYAFHDTDLSKIVRHGYQALAIDEHRQDFTPTKWVREPASLLAGELATAPKPEQIDVQQRWFIGAHADVGGGEPSDGAGHQPDGLSDLALAWLRERAAGAGLAFKAAFAPAPAAPLEVPNDSYAQFMFGIYKWFKSPFRREMGGGINETIDPSVWLKWQAQPAYRPLSVETAIKLGRVRPDQERIDA